MEKLEPSALLVEMKIAKPLWETAGGSPEVCRCAPAIPVLGLCLKDWKWCFRDICIPVFILALFTRAFFFLLVFRYPIVPTVFIEVSPLCLARQSLLQSSCPFICVSSDLIC